MFRIIAVLTVICVAAALILGVAYNATRPLITAQKENEQKLALEVVMPGADEYKKRSQGEMEYYEVYKDGVVFGYIIPAKANGYSGKIDMLAGIDKQARITGIAVLSQSETPGLGSRCAEVTAGDKEPWFLKQFKGISAAEIDIKNIQAITGATITTEAIVKAVKETAALFIERLK